MEALPATSPLTRSNAKSAQKYHMTPASFFTGAPPATVGRKEIEKPRPSPAGPRKSQYAVISARETSLVHPLKVDSRINEVHITIAVRLKPRITMLLKRKRIARSSGRDRLPNTTRSNGSCLCAISQLATYMSCRVGRSRAETPSIRSLLTAGMLINLTLFTATTAVEIKHDARGHVTWTIEKKIASPELIKQFAEFFKPS